MVRSLNNYTVKPSNWMVAQVALVLSVSLIGCGSQDGSKGDGVGLAIATPLSSAAQALTSQGSVTATPQANNTLLLADGSHQLVLKSVGVVLREIEFKRADDARECGVEGEASKPCESFEMGPMLLSVPLDGSVEHAISAAIPAGSYDEVEFDIHKAEGERDAAFIQAHPEFDKLSIRATGSFDDAPFTYKSELDQEQEIALTPPLSVLDGMGTSVTLSIDVLHWFTDGNGALFDPRDPEKTDEIKENIKASLKGYEDRDEDGESDEEEAD